MTIRVIQWMIFPENAEKWLIRAPYVIKDSTFNALMQFILHLY